MIINADMHIHSCLSPCGSLEMSPSVIVDNAVKAGLNLIALTDHNTSLNCPTLKKICERRNDLKCFFGMEATSIEEVHCLCLFDDLDASMDFSSFIYSCLPDIIHNPDKTGDQVFVDEDENILGEVEKLLLSATSLSTSELLVEVHNRGGLFIPAHIEREAYSMTSQLGFLPVDDYDAIELSKYFYKRNNPTELAGILNAEKYPQITNSDSHYPDGIGKAYFEIDLDEISILAMKQALLKRNHKNLIFL